MNLNSIKEELKLNRNYIYIVFLVNICIFACGFWIGRNSSYSFEFIKSDSGSTVSYLINNSFYLSICQLGILNFGLTTSVLIFINGYNFGVLIPHIIEQRGLLLFMGTFSIYGLMELIGIFSAALIGQWGYVLAYKAWKKSLTKNDFKFVTCICVFSYICIIIAAVLEGIINWIIK